MAESEAIQAALKLLSMRARSRRELAQLLVRRGFSTGEAEEAVAKATEWGYLDDHAFARARAQKLLGEGRFGARVVLMRLVADGIPRRDAEAAIRRVTQEQGTDAKETAQKLLAARRLDLGDERSRARAVRLLTTRGFSTEVIQAVTGVEVSEAPPDPE